MRILIGAALFWAIVTVLAFTTPAGAQQACFDYDVARERLTGKYGETIVAVRTSEDGSTGLELWANEETGTWTILAVPAGSGLACLVTSGKDFVPKPKGDPS